jgi:uncharacterized damage-inducible protein DinB
MTVAITLDELLAWNEEASNSWKGLLEDNPTLLQLPCDIGGVANVQQFIRHIWGAELRWAQRLAGIPETPRDTVPSGPLDALFDLHLQAVPLFRGLLANPAYDWEATYTLDVSWLPPHARTSTHRKILGHALFHSQRHWAQLATLVRAAGLPYGFNGDLLFSSALR